MPLAESGLLEGLIATKLIPPASDLRAISRKALIARHLDHLPQSPVMTIVAPAGSGKSSLMAQLHAAFSSRQIATAWLSLDAEDDDPATFAIYLINALHAIEPFFARDELTALGANPVRDFDSLFERLVSCLSAVAAPGALLLDDFQHITDPRILRFLDRLIAHLPRDLSLVLASRSDLALQLARLRVSGTITEITQDELNFDGTQARLFLKRYHDLELSPGDLEALLESTEGWPTGVQLAALALRRHKGPAGELIKTFSGRDRDLTRYLVESVLRVQPENVRGFLLRSSPLRRMCADLCVATTGQAESSELLDYLGRANLFLVALDSEGQWYRYHHLFSEFLQNEFRRVDPQGYREACHRAAKWCEVHGQPTEAIRYFLDGENFEQAADLIARHALQASLFRGDHYTVLDWMRRLPQAFHDRRPEILLAHAWSCAFSRDTARAMDISQRALDELSATDSGRWRLPVEERSRWLLWAQNVQAATKACADDIEDCLARATALRPAVPESEPFLIATLSNCISYSHFVRRAFEPSREAAIAAHHYGHRAGAAYLSAWGDFLHGLIDVELGRLHEAEVFGKRVRRDSQGLGLGQRSYVAGLSALLNAEIAAQRGDFGLVAKLIATGRAFKETFGPVEPQLVALRNEARLHAHLGQPDLASQVLQQGQDAALREKHHRLYLALVIEEATLQLSAGDPGGSWGEVPLSRLQREAGGGHELSRAQRGALRLLEARFLLADGDAPAALRILTTMQRARGADNCGVMFLSIATLRAIALWENGQEKEGMRQFDRALSSAAAEQHVYPIVSAGRRLLPILESIAEHRVLAETPELRSKVALQGWLLSYLRGDRSLARAHPQEATSPGSSPTPATEPLTERELELLRLLQAGLSNRKLADALLISEATVKSHLHNIYCKLYVGSRGAAVARAVQLGML